MHATSHHARIHMASTTANPPADKPASSGKFKRIALIAVIALGAAAAAAAGMYVFMGRQGAAHASAAEPAPLAAPVFFPLDPLTVNLQSDDGVQHYLRVGLSLKLTDPKAQEQLTARMPEIRSRVLLALSNKHPEDIATPDGKQALAQQLRNLIEEPTQPGNQRTKVDDVLFTEFVVQ
ncbi:TPA: flagellar basal body-associated protein FliL [Burkholderia multivorans]|uniref:flagellar basal body-associated protein FliL n=1 Tax=Burkholderia multivorans TaxID=87883 RepID=UPI000CFE9129|nr:flagellar basal body-associated protein FliL [Burkholderia multivorans]MBU9301107.1 flagellar basal body-associated protein FliL [Burkholderia multivorans]MBU9306660.1 flagellar basal body-associated protein FliL [Burkholderia multivorans]MBU9408008.1 flagellar basal body-associated protein FliL [Burkholderia multivorans]MBU9504623.1 flagellar basal body-associated protein FliL [Burkholderia multivorans]MBU9510582.1 flagellar basal body-associated protein FliL [Burkholderia multivorans]